MYFRLYTVFLVSSFFVQTQFLYAQKFRIELNKDKIYEYIINPITVSAYGVKCENIFATADNGDLKGDACSYDLEIVNHKNVVFQVFKIEEEDTLFLGEKNYPVARLPDLSVELGGKQSGEMINVDELKAQTGLAIPESYHNLMDCSRLEIDYYKIIVMLNGGTIYEFENYGPNFDEAFESFKNNLLPDSKGVVSFEEIMVITPDKKQKTEIDGLQFYLVK